MSGVESDEMEIRRLHIYAVLSQTLLDNECWLWIITRQLLEVIRSSLLAELYVLLVLLMGRCLLSDTDLQQYSPHYLTSIQGRKLKKKKRHYKTSCPYYSMLICSICGLACVHLFLVFQKFLQLFFTNTLLIGG